ncbi:ABC transporter substrate-binding protein [Camelimonas abortus]|uniref:ABC transporter substrate-binding protein n=2 Tax=Camelimonas abortus TaxID=1017184 RepID=A0ABV7LCH4_9HYPH
MTRDRILPAASLSRRAFLALAAAAGAAAASGGASASAGAPKRGGVLRLAASANPSSLDPATGGSGYDHSFLWTIYDTLTEWDYDTLQPKPGLAKWSYPDRLTMVLDLQPGVTFHDGTPLDAEAVKFNIDRSRLDQRSNVKADLTSIAETVVTGPLQVTLKLKNPDAALPAIFSDRCGMMISPAAVQKHGQASDRNPVGAGPWKFVSWADNQKVVVARNENYWRDDRGFLDSIEFSIIPEYATALRSVTAGQNDMAFALPARLKPVIERAKNLQVVTAPTLYCVQFYLNTKRKPLDDVRVRRALNHAVDRDAFVRATMGGLGEPATMTLPKSHWAWSETASKLYPHDVEKARALLAEAGYPDGIELTVGAYTDQDNVRRAEVLQEQLGKAGVRLKFTRGTVAEISANFFNQGYDMLLSAWTGRPDPSMTYALGFDKGAYYNASREASDELSDLIRKSRESEDTRERAAVFDRIQQITMGEALSVPLAFQYELDALSPKVRGYRPDLLGKPKFEFVWLGE